MVGVNAKNGMLLIRVKVSPNAGKSAAAGEHAGALKLKVAAPPDKGKANREVADFLAGELGVKKADVEILQGEASRDKVVGIRGIDKEALELWLKRQEK